MERFGQIYFDFKDWKEAFKCWDENQHLYEGKIRMVISEHPYSSGYWIEDMYYELGEGSIAFNTNEEVQDLKRKAELTSEAMKNLHSTIEY